MALGLKLAIEGRARKRREGLDYLPDIKNEENLSFAELQAEIKCAIGGPPLK